ncbi:NAD(P)/FAD-dependent oxidoreductase [Diaminobutyricimonas sp. LJ205]|uniref:NAD(P)/FAD-dependent oxidoreductase n=1 Tax=Diaminobutyricimonas sp. LJ205 TaxID=2683590 RepID=UPI0012F4C12B|nr:FAD-dependent oxidoreductase [Diaminobutyricimonas sp. LJ205]
MRSVTESSHTVLVVGGGYAGIMAANRLRSSLSPAEAAAVRITVISPSAQFVERVRLHQVAAGSLASAARPLQEMLHGDIDVVSGSVTTIESAAQQVRVTTPNGTRVMPYDSLVYTVGSMAALSTPGVAEHSHPLADPNAASLAQATIAAGGPGQRIVVVGGGSTGVEAAAEIAEQHPAAQVTLLSSGPVLGRMRPSAQRDIRRVLDRLGIGIREGARVDRVQSDAVILTHGATVPFDVCIWAASFAVPQLAADSGLATDSSGRLLVDECLRSVEYPSIVGAGDAVRVPASVGAHLRMSCAAALPLGGAAADTVLARLRGQQPRPISIGYVVHCLSLGRKNGYIQLLAADDRPRRLHVRGPLAARIKEAIVRITVSGPLKERSKPRSYWAPHGPRRLTAEPVSAEAGAIR